AYQLHELAVLDPAGHRSGGRHRQRVRVGTGARVRGQRGPAQDSHQRGGTSFRGDRVRRLQADGSAQERAAFQHQTTTPGKQDTRQQGRAIRALCHQRAQEQGQRGRVSARLWPGPQGSEQHERLTAPATPEPQARGHHL
ncbi:MAG: hypothetical protein AVDCRST_MAG03-3618, partial [uncultured Rubrobacteraceae bacterium]